MCGCYFFISIAVLFFLYCTRQNPGALYHWDVSPSLFYFDIGSHKDVQVDLELVNLFPQPPEYWNFLHSYQHLLLSKFSGYEILILHNLFWNSLIIRKFENIFIDSSGFLVYKIAVQVFYASCIRLFMFFLIDFLKYSK